jgi:predicted MFS family arabinose efflux permease
VTFQSWRVIFYLQTALAGVAFIGAYFLLPETIHRKKSDDLVGLTFKRKARVLWGMTNPWRVIRLYKYPNLIMVALASSSLVWNMYSLLTPIRYVLNPRFNLTSPIQSGLFYLAPGGGYILGTFFGGRYADYITISWAAKRNGVRVPEDRLRSCLPFMGIAMPICMLIYGWSIEKRFGGIALPVIMMFLQGVSQLFCFPSLNTYCLDVMQADSAEVIAGNYVIRYLFAALGSATVLPAVESIGVGWFSTISAAFLVASSVATGAAVIWGRGWRERIDERRRARRKVQWEGVEADKVNSSEKGIVGSVVVDGKGKEEV